MKKVFVFMISIAMLCVFCSCNGKSESEKTSGIDGKEVVENGVMPEFNINLRNIELSEGVFHSTEHEKYVNDPMEFGKLPTQGIEEGDTAVVGSHVAVLYPEEFFKFSDVKDFAVIDSDADVQTEPVGFGTILKIIGSKIKNSNPENSYCQNMFNYQNNWNWFYPVETPNGRTGYIFGADLKGINDSLERNQMTALLYNKNGRMESFYPYAGYEPLNNAIKSGLEKDKLVMQLTTPEKYVYPDDLIEKYSDLTYRKYIPLFVTTDLIAHSQHLVFDRLLQYTEENYFRPRLMNLCEKFIEQLNNVTDIEEKYVQCAKAYFEVGKLLLSEGEPDLESVSEAAVTDYNNIMTMSSSTDAIFGVEEDFSQYKPRGHYTKNEALESYFRAQMWFGRLSFLIAASDVKNSSSNQLLITSKTAMLICNIVRENNQLYSLWQKIFDPITDLIGYCDDLSFKEILPLYDAQKVSDFSEWMKDDANILDFMELCHQKLRSPLISGNSVFSGAYDTSGENSASEGEVKSVEDRKPPMNWRLLGQRFTWDSYIHQQVCAPKLFKRDFVKGLDIMKVFGSRSADALLSDEYESYPELKGILDELQKRFESYKPDFWNQSYYNQTLYQIKTIADFEQGAGFYFTETPAWNVKAMISSHAVWAELRHDTILYAKQSYAERAGDGDYEPTYRTEPVPVPVNYIEPNLPFFEITMKSVKKIMDTYYIYDLLDDESKWCLRSFYETLEKMYDIVLLEVKDQPISTEQNYFIRTVSNVMRNIVLVHVKGSIEDYDKLKMALVADVFTNSDQHLCLEVGTGVPVRYYIPLNDNQGGKRIAVGYGFSYYEFLQPQDNRLNDEEWKDLVYNRPSEITDKLPEWEQKCFTPDDDLLLNYR